MLFNLTSFPQPLTVKACLSAERALKQISVFQPDLVLMDLVMPYQTLSGIDVLEVLQRDFPDIVKIALTSFGTDLSDQDLLRLAACQLDGFVAKVSQGTVHCLERCYQIWQGEAYFEPFYQDRLLALAVQPEPLVLSERQRELVILRAQGFTLPEMAEKTGISPTTVKTHLQRIESKLGLRKVPEFFAYARQQHWL